MLAAYPGLQSTLRLGRTSFMGYLNSSSNGKGMSVYSIHVLCLLYTEKLENVGNLLTQTLARDQSIIESVVRGQASFHGHPFLFRKELEACLHK